MSNETLLNPGMRISPISVGNFTPLLVKGLHMPEKMR